MNLQHDGIVTGSLGGRQSQEVARGMQEAASHASGHEVQVKGELIWFEAASAAGRGGGGGAGGWLGACGRGHRTRLVCVWGGGLLKSERALC